MNERKELSQEERDGAALSREALLSDEAEVLLSNMRLEHVTNQQIMDSMEDGEYLEKEEISQELVEEVHEAMRVHLENGVEIIEETFEDELPSEEMLAEARKFGFVDAFHCPENLGEWIEHMLTGVIATDKMHVYTMVQGTMNNYALSMAEMALELDALKAATK